MKTKKKEQEEPVDETEVEGSPAEEFAETPEEESAEEDSQEGVKVPEDFQIACHGLLKNCNDKACLSYLRDAIYAKEDELRKSESDEKPEEFSTEAMPSS